MNAERASRLADYLAGAELLRVRAAELPPESLDFRPGPGRWTIREVLIHLADAEVQAYLRCRVILAEPGATMENYDQDAWATGLNYAGGEPGPAIELFGLVRRLNYTLVKDLPEATWAQSANHAIRGPVTLDDWLTTYAEHLHIHLRQIDRNLAAWRAATA